MSTYLKAPVTATGWLFCAKNLDKKIASGNSLSPSIFLRKMFPLYARENDFVPNNCGQHH